MEWTKTRRTVGAVLLWSLSALLGVGFALAGIGKFSPPWPRMFADWGFPVWFTYAVGVAELVAGVLLLVPKTAVLGAATLALIMVGATGTHLVHGESNWSFTLTLVVLFTTIGVARYRGRQAPAGQ